MNAVRTVTVIPPKLNFIGTATGTTQSKKRVAAYARVSTENEEQQSSQENQVGYFTEHIQNNADWTFVEVYTDEGISGTSTKKREGFNRMIADALDGKIDLILVKSISRFARNTVDTLTIIRKLKECNVEVHFENESIFTLDSKGELLLTIMSSLAQNESRTISENVKWGKRQSFANGNVSLPYKRFLGFEKGENGRPKIVEEEAEVIRQIYSLFLQGKTFNAIASQLTAEGIPTPSGREVWSVSSVMSILQNEKYKGDAILQKTYTKDFLTKKIVINDGSVKQTYVKNSHAAIIEPEIFDIVQSEINKRKAIGKRQTGLECFSSRIVCGDCGSFYGSKVWHSTTKYRRTIWQCNSKFKGIENCATPHMYDEILQGAFVQAFNKVITEKEQILAEYGAEVAALMDTTKLDKEIVALEKERLVLGELSKRCIEENASVALDQDEYHARHASLVVRDADAKKRIADLNAERNDRLARRDAIRHFLDGLAERDGILATFDETLFCETVERMTLHKNLTAVVAFKNGQEVSVDVSGK